MKQEREAAAFVNESADFFFKGGQQDQAINTYKESVENFKRNGNFDSAGVALRKIGEYYESEYEPELAAENFKKAAEMFGLAKYHTTDSAKLKVKVADLYAQMFDRPERLKEAIDVG